MISDTEQINSERTRDSKRDIPCVAWKWLIGTSNTCVTRVDEARIDAPR